MKRMKLTREEKAIEAAAEKYVPMNPAEFAAIVEAIKRRKKDAVLSIRVNAGDLDRIKAKAKKAGVPYQALIAEFIQHYARSPRA
jgi:predicted DNA binding CopG/RHH family protein